MLDSTHKSTCKYFVARKNRYCRMIPLLGFEYCAEHQQSNLSTNADSSNILPLRIPCPLDNKHTCYAIKLEKHLKVCNSKKDTSAPYFCEGINSSDRVDTDQNEKHSLLLSAVPLHQITELVSKINKIYKERIENNITDKILESRIVEDEISKSTYGPKTKKHLHQASSLVGILDNYELLKSDACYIELGAGKGQLSYWIYKAIEHSGAPSLLLVDKGSQRHKFDNKLDKVDGTIQRIRIDIADLILHEVDVVKRSKGCIGVSKHLCGDATDLALRCLTKNNEERNKVLGLAMALCCHHRCQWSAYVGKKFLEEVHLTSMDFNIMVRLVSWATCGDRNKSSIIEENNDRFKEVGLDRLQREEIGRRCKYIIDFGRLAFLEEQGLNCFLHFYVTRDVSLENVCLVGINKKLDN